MDDVFAHKNFILNAGNHTDTIISKHNDFVNIRAFTYEFVFFKTHPNKAFLPIYIKLGIVGRYKSCFNRIKIRDFSLSLLPFTIFFEQPLIIRDRKFSQMVEVVKRLLEFLLKLIHQLICLKSIKL